MSDVEKLLSFTELSRDYPSVERWFEDPLNVSAQILDNRRLMSAQEKLALFGGRERVRDNLSVITISWRDSYVALLACRQEPMVHGEILKFGEMIGRRLGYGVLWPVTLRPLVNEGRLIQVDDLTYVRREHRNPDRFSLSLRNGLLTTDEGIKDIMLRMQEQTGDKGVKRVLVPEQG